MSQVGQPVYSVHSEKMFHIGIFFICISALFIDVELESNISATFKLKQTSLSLGPCCPLCTKIENLRSIYSLSLIYN